MSDQQSENVETATTENAPTIEELAAQFDQSQPEQREQLDNSHPISQPDPVQTGYVDPDEVMRAQMSEQAKSLSEVNHRLEAYEQREASAQEQKDIDLAVNTVSEVLPDVDKDLITGILNAEYTKDPNFQTIWNNREQNSKVLEQALNTIASKYKGKFALKVDPQATEAVHAANDLMNSVGGSSGENDLLTLSDDQFASAWNARG